MSDKIVYVNSITELLNKVKYARHGTTYVLMDAESRFSRYAPSGMTELRQQVQMLENLIQLQRSLGVESCPAIVFKKSFRRRSG